MQDTASTSTPTGTQTNTSAAGDSQAKGVRVAFKMKLFPGREAEYKRRHNEIWPELQQLLKDAGIRDYSIFLDEESHALFGVLTIANKQNLDALPQQEVMQRWWRYMADIMESNPDQSPVSIPLQEVFFLP